MLSDKLINEALVGILTQIFPKKTELANYISDTLSIEKETAYRRLRGVSMFAFSEAAILSQRLNFSLDEIIMRVAKDEMISNMALQSYYAENKKKSNESESDLFNFIIGIASGKESEMGIALKSIPFQLLHLYPTLSNYYKYKYVLHSKKTRHPLLFKEVESIPDGLEEPAEWEKLHKMFHNISRTIYIWDKKNIPTIVSDIKYFRSLGVIDDDELLQLKAELLQFLEDFENVATLGIYEDTKNKCDIFISDEDIDSTYCYFKSESRCLSVLVTHMVYMIVSNNNKSKCEEMQTWIASMKYNSTLISSTSAKERVSFFKQQAEVVRSLTNC